MLGFKLTSRWIQRISWWIAEETTPSSPSPDMILKKGELVVSDKKD
jgi:hypothetical protein